MFEEQIITTFGDWSTWAVVFICAFLPIIEARVAIPLGCATAVWGSGAMSIFGASAIAFIASSLAGILIVLTLSPIMKKLRKKKKRKYLANKIETFFNNKINKLSKNKKRSTFKTILFLIIFIALPLPLMGVYSGAGIGVFLKLKWWQSFLAITVGNAISCLLIALTCWILYPFIPLLLTCLIIIILLIITWYIINLCWDFNYKKHQKKTAKVASIQ